MADGCVMVAPVEPRPEPKREREVGGVRLCARTDKASALEACQRRTTRATPRPVAWTGSGASPPWPS